MLLYVHVPFCRQKCRYCGFYSNAVGKHADSMEKFAPYQAWKEGVLEEIEFWGEKFALLADRNRHFPHEDIETVFFGGGTPSLVQPDDMADILARIRRYFVLVPNAEISMEANPESMTGDKPRRFREAGINRVSLGVQSLNDEALKRMGRLHDSRQFLKAYEGLRQAGFENIGLDFIWGLPSQSLPDWLAELKKIIALNPEHLSCYGLSIEENSVFARMMEQGILELPSEREQADMYLQGAEMLEQAGYQQYEISNFARKGFESRHNSGYWTGRDYLGFGSGAVSTLSMEKAKLLFGRDNSAGNATVNTTGNVTGNATENTKINTAGNTKVTTTEKAAIQTAAENKYTAENKYIEENTYVVGNKSIAKEINPAEDKGLAADISLHEFQKNRKESEMADLEGEKSASSPFFGAALRWTNPHLKDWLKALPVRREEFSEAFPLTEEACSRALHAEVEILDEKERFLEYIMLGLRTTRGICLENCSQGNLQEKCPELLAELEKENFVALKEGYLRLTPKGMLISNSIIERFFEEIK